MAMKLEFKSIKNKSIFQPEFQNLVTNGYNVIELKKQPQASGGIAVVYAPNGTGKSSLTLTLGNTVTTDEMSFEAMDNNNTAILPETKAFHIIGDQISRNVIEGETSDYLIGRDIRREYELKKKLANGFENAFTELNAKYKNEYKTTKVRDYLLSILQMRNTRAFEFVRDIVNVQSKGKRIDRNLFMAYVRDVQNQPRLLTAVDQDKKSFIIGNVKLIEQLMKVNLERIVVNANVQVIEQNTDAVGILEKYKHLHMCIVCDNDNIDSESLLQQKTENKKRIYESLDTETKKLLEKVAMDAKLTAADPFEIKDTVLTFISSGEIHPIINLKDEISVYLNEIIDEMIVEMFNVFGPEMYSWWDEYVAMLETQPALDNEELLFIQEIISENIGKEIHITRDNDNDHNFKLMLDDKELLGLDRSKMQLSTGEQNFISLAFALLLARHSDQEFIVLDDPISSFDSVYKNKIAFCIIKFLEKKKQVVLTHNTDLIRLLNVQLKDCFNLYILNNVPDGKNGFLPIKKSEKEILLSLSSLIELFQNKNGRLDAIIHNKRLFLMSMIPFLRGYIHIMNDPEDLYGKLSRVMHGYENGSIDVADVYKKAFGYEIENMPDVISVSDVLAISVDELDIIDAEEYPLLADTLVQTLIYYHIRMKVEHELVDIFNIPHREGEILLLTDIIRKAFKPAGGATQEEKDKLRNYRVFFTSRKTLLNEFNHFEGNMNIFQPAIDITETTLQKEIADIENTLMQLRMEYATIH